MSEKTIRVRIAVAVNANGEWHAMTHGNCDPKEAAALCKVSVRRLDHNYSDTVVHWIEADIPLPASVTVEGKVVT